jgi:N-acetylglucosamine-6-phosphate deacetylase
LLGPEGFGVYAFDPTDPGSQPERVSRPPHGLLVPGFVDVHIHGAYGIDFMGASAEELRVLSGRLEEAGYEAYLPTTITASADRVLDVIGRLPVHPAIAGFHLEGPFISPVFPGAQPPSAIAEPPDGPGPWDEVLDHPRLRVVTMAPELPRALELILWLQRREVIVSMGHTNATFEEARRGFEFGARHTTHTFNAMRGLHHREAGTVGFALQAEGLVCELIYDRQHVCREAARLLLNCKGAAGVIAVSDSTMATGMAPGLEIEMWGLKCLTHPGRVTLADGKTLAGSAITLLDAFRNLTQDFGEEAAIRLCSLNPRRALGMCGAPKVYVEFDKDLHAVRLHRRALGAC